MIRISENKLSPAEKEDKKVDRLTNKKTPKSRKYRSKRGPKYDNRKRDINESDPDLNINTVEGDRDLSLNYKYSANDHFVIAALNIISSVTPLESAIKAYEKDLRKASFKIADAFLIFSEWFYLEPAIEGQSGFNDDGVSDIKTKHSNFKKLKLDLSKYLVRATPNNIVKAITSTWPSDENDYGTRAAVIGALHKCIDTISLPQALKVPFLRKNVKSFVNDEQFIQRIIESSKNKSGTKIDEKLVPRFAQLAAAYQMVSSNPKTVNAATMENGIDALTDSISSQFEEINQLNSIMAVWHDSISGLRHEPQKAAELGKSSHDYDKIIASIDNFFKGDKKIIDVDKYLSEMDKYADKHYGGTPVELSDLKPESEEYEEPDVDVEDDINPQGKPLSLDDEEPDGIEEIESKKIHDDEELEKIVQHYVDLLAQALKDQDSKEINKFLKELYYETSGNLDEDVARIASRCIATSYEKHLNRHMNIRKSSYHGVVDQKGNPTDPTNTGYKSYDKRYFGKDHYDSIVKVAQELLKDSWLSSGWDGGATDAPIRAALDLSIHTADNSLYQSKIDTETYNLLLNRLAKWGYDTFSETLLPFKKGENSNRSASMKPEHQAILKIANDIRLQHPMHAVSILKHVRALVSSEETSADPKEISFRSMKDDDFKKLRSEMEQVLESKFDDNDINQFLAGFDKLYEKLEHKVAGHVSPGLLNLLSSSAVPFSKLMTVASLDKEELRKVLSVSLANIRAASDPQALLIEFNSICRNIQRRASKNITPSVSLSELVRLAHSNPSVRSVLLPIIAAKAKKSKKKVSLKKKDEKEKDKLMKGDKKSSKSKVKKAALNSSDMDW